MNKILIGLFLLVSTVASAQFNRITVGNGDGVFKNDTVKIIREADTDTIKIWTIGGHAYFWCLTCTDINFYPTTTNLAGGVITSVNGQTGVVVITNITGNAGTVTTNANLTGAVTSAGNATSYNQNLPVNKLNSGTNASSSTVWYGDGQWKTVSGGSLADGDKGDITVSGGGSVWSIDANAVTNSMLLGGIDLTTKVTGILPGLNGGTGINNNGKTITLGGNLSTTGAFNSVFAQSGSNIYTLPAGTSNIASLNLTETFTGLKVFSNGTISLRNPAANHFYTLKHGAITGDYDLNIPIISSNSTIAVNSVNNNFLTGQTTTKIGVGTPPVNLIDVAAGSTTLAPIKLTSGTLNTSPQTGGIEFDGIDYYGSIDGIRYILTRSLKGEATLDFPNTAPGTNADLTFTVTGAVAGDVVALGVPNGSTLPSSSYTAWVSAANRVNVRFNNYSSSTGDPASGLFKANVIK